MPAETQEVDSFILSVFIVLVCVVAFAAGILCTLAVVRPCQ